MFSTIGFQGGKQPLRLPVFDHKNPVTKHHENSVKSHYNAYRLNHNKSEFKETRLNRLTTALYTKSYPYNYVHNYPYFTCIYA
jgi:hypothetical protein